MKHIKKINEYSLHFKETWFDNDDKRKQYVTKNFLKKSIHQLVL